MNNLVIRKVVKITAHFTWQDWHLIDTPLSASVALVLNRTLDDYFNRGESREVVLRNMKSTMKSCSDFGAACSGAMRHLELVLDEIYKVE